MPTLDEPAGFLICLARPAMSAIMPKLTECVQADIFHDSEKLVDASKGKPHRAAKHSLLSCKAYHFELQGVPSLR